MCGLSSCQRIHCGQDSTCSGQDLWLLRTRCASDEYSLFGVTEQEKVFQWFMELLLCRGNRGTLCTRPRFCEHNHCWVVCLCGCCAAFEATRFYNVSESSPLARELCDGPTCNEVESSTNHWIGEILLTFMYLFVSIWPIDNTSHLCSRLCARKPVQQCVWLSGGGTVWTLHLLQRLRLWRWTSVWVRRPALPEPVPNGCVCLSK